jgi:hypothetical protein
LFKIPDFRTNPVDKINNTTYTNFYKVYYSYVIYKEHRDISGGKYFTLWKGEGGAGK